MNKEEKDRFEQLSAQIKSETDRIADKYFGKVVIANQYQLMRSGEKLFTPEHKKILQSKQPVEASHVAIINSQWYSCGKLYEVDEDATEEWQEKLRQHKENLKEMDRIEKEAGQALVGALKGVKAEKIESNQGEEPKQEKAKKTTKNK